MIWVGKEISLAPHQVGLELTEAKELPIGNLVSWEFHDEEDNVHVSCVLSLSQTEDRGYHCPDDGWIDCSWFCWRIVSIHQLVPHWDPCTLCGDAPSNDCVDPDPPHEPYFGSKWADCPHTKNGMHDFPFRWEKE